MTDLTPSNDVVYRMYECHENEGWATASALLFEGAQTIERLTRENELMRSSVHKATEATLPLVCERDRLRAALEAASVTNVAVLLRDSDAQNQRLRAALKRASSIHPHGGVYFHGCAGCIASEALSGKQETRDG